MEDESSGIRRAELIAALSLALNLAIGVEIESSFRTCIVAQRLGKAIGLSEQDLWQTYYLSLLKFLGCSSDAETASRVFGDEIAIGDWISPAVGGGPISMMTAMVQHHGAGSPLPQRLRVLATAFMRMPEMKDTSLAHCEVAQRLARRMGFDEEICERLTEVFEYWNGSGKPKQIQKDRISLPARIITLVEDAQMFAALGGVGEAIAIARKRSGKAYDPALVGLFCDQAHAFFAGLDEAATWAGVLDAEPGPHDVLSDAALDGCLEALADFCDLKSRYFRGHSTVVAELVAGAATQLRLPPAEATQLRRAALVHEIGMVGISNSIVDKEGSLSEVEQERLRMHSYYTDRVLARPPALAQLGAIAAAHHERLDGSGYHRGSIGQMQTMPARILIAACAYQTEVSSRPGHPSRMPAEAAASMQVEVAGGRLDGDAVGAVLAAAGHTVRPMRQSLPAGLSEREVEVLRLIAQGLSRREIAGQLVIADKTVAHHIEHIYNKIGTSSRPAATLFALQNGLLRT